jgi:HEPN domain-containing protein
MGYGRPDVTTFMLHQAVEHTCSAPIRVFTGYRPNAHNLTQRIYKHAPEDRQGEIAFISIILRWRWLKYLTINCL